MVVKLSELTLLGLKLARQFTLTDLHLLQGFFGLLDLEFELLRHFFHVLALDRIRRLGGLAIKSLYSLLCLPLPRPALVQPAAEVFQLTGDASHLFLLKFEPLYRDLNARPDLVGTLDGEAKLTNLGQQGL